MCDLFRLPNEAGRDEAVKFAEWKVNVSVVLQSDYLASAFDTKVS